MPHAPSVHLVPGCALHGCDDVAGLSSARNMCSTHANEQLAENVLAERGDFRLRLEQHLSFFAAESGEEAAPGRPEHLRGLPSGDSRQNRAEVESGPHARLSGR